MDKNNINEHIKLIINLNESNKIQIENGNIFKESIFKDVYISATNNVMEIIHQSNRNNLYDDYNNIIAFTGERGKGKSSSMISFRNALIDYNNEIHSDFFKEYDTIKQLKFASIEIIDPSLFKGGESLFEIILTYMFNNFQENAHAGTLKLNHDDRRKIIQNFQSVFENLQIIKSTRDELYKKESIEALSRLAASSTLRKCFKNLTENYLKKFENNKNFLIIAIDDFDLNINGAYEMLEDIRQFLIQSNIIILIACKIEQLREIVLNNTYKDYKYLLKYKSKEISELELINKTEKYLEKLIPYNKRIQLPDLKVF